jgi:hypothetical protein
MSTARIAFLPQNKKAIGVPATRPSGSHAGSDSFYVGTPAGKPSTAQVAHLLAQTLARQGLFDSLFFAWF